MSATAAPPPPGGTSLDRKIVRGLAWTGGVRWGAQILSWAGMLVIARLLAPSDFGYIALVSVWTRLLLLITEGGFGAAIVLGPPLERETLSQLNGLALAMAAAAFGIACAIAGPLARFYHSGSLAWVMIAVSATFLFEGAQLVPGARLRRAMRFREMAFADLARAVADLGTTLVLAFSGFGYWSLVGGLAAGIAASAFVLVRRCPTPVHRPRWLTLRPVARFAVHLLVPGLASFCYTSADVVIAGRLLGASAVGAYGFAGSLASAPGDKLVSVISRVSPAVFGTVAGDRAAVRRYVLRLTRLLAMLVLPALGGIAITATDLVPVLLGPGWTATIRPLQLFAVHAAVASLTAIVPQVLQSAGRERLVSRSSIVALCLYPPAFVLMGRQWGIAGIAGAWALIGPPIALWLVWRMCRAIALPLREYVAQLLPSLASTALMAVVVIGITHVLRIAHAGNIALLATQVIVGALSYAAGILALDGTTARKMLSLLRGGHRDVPQMRAGVVPRKPLAVSDPTRSPATTPSPRESGDVPCSSEPLG